MPKKLKVNETFFSEINDEQKAYWFGFLLADGCITKDNRIRIELSMKDLSHIEKFKLALGSEHKISKNIKRSSDKLVKIRTETASFQILRKVMVQDLLNLGFQYNKSLTLKFPVQFPESYLIPMVRGYFDGNGCISGQIKKFYQNGKNYEYYVPYASIAGSKDFLNGVNERLSVNGKLYSCKLPSSKELYYLRFCSKPKTLHFLNIIYTNSSIFLDRKYNHYLKLLDL